MIFRTLFLLVFVGILTTHLHQFDNDGTSGGLTPPVAVRTHVAEALHALRGDLDRNDDASDARAILLTRLSRVRAEIEQDGALRSSEFQDSLRRRPATTNERVN